MQRELPCQVLSQLLARRVWPLSSLRRTPHGTGLLSRGLAHQGLLVLMLGCDVPLLGEHAQNCTKSLVICAYSLPLGRKPSQLARSC